MKLPLHFAAQLVQDLAPKFSMGSKRRTLVAVLAIVLPFLGYFVWLYYREWKIKRDFQRYWQGKQPNSRD